MKEKVPTFLADESCDFAAVRGLRSVGYDVIAVAEAIPSAPDEEVLQFAARGRRILLTEDKDFGEWVFAHGKKMAGVLLIRFPGNARSLLAESVTQLVTRHSGDLAGAFTVLEPGRARIRRMKTEG